MGGMRMRFQHCYKFKLLPLERFFTRLHIFTSFCRLGVENVEARILGRLLGGGTAFCNLFLAYMDYLCHNAPIASLCLSHSSCPLSWNFGFRRN